MRNWKPRPPSNPDASLYRPLKIYIPKASYAMLSKQAASMGLPLSRLAAYAIDNEFDAPAPFNYPCLMPSTTYVPHAYIDEAQKIAKFLGLTPAGLSRDSVMLARHEIGIPDRDILMLALRELIEVGVVEEVKPSKRTKFKYPDNYRVVRLVRVDTGALVSKKRITLQAMRDKLDRELAALEETGTKVDSYKKGTVLDE